jgi:hypothetical protein
MPAKLPAITGHLAAELASGAFGGSGAAQVSPSVSMSSPAAARPARLAPMVEADGP